MFRRVVHCDWSKNAPGRWAATARRRGAGWRADGPAPVPADLKAFVVDLLDPAEGPTLAAFDFPVGLPLALRGAMGGGAFPDALERFGSDGPLRRVLSPAATPDEVGPLRPFYPEKPGAARQAHLLDGLGAARLADLMRACERADGPFAGCMLWLIGAKAVGKAAIGGWTDVVRPARAAGARLWPFDGDLADLAPGAVLVVAESYPADAYGQLGLKVRRKGDPAVLRALAPQILAWTEARGVALAPALRDAIATGFAAFKGHHGDAFDAAAGLLAALPVADGRRPAAPPLDDAVRRWEGWILGRGVPDPGRATRVGSRGSRPPAPLRAAAHRSRGRHPCAPP